MTVCRSARLLLGGVFVLALAVFCLACSQPKVQEEEVYISPYDWSGLEHDQGRCYYYKEGTLASKVGIDVSDHQGIIDWESVAADGIDFAMIRLGNRGYSEGKIYLDSRYEANIEGACAAGIEVGLYFFSQAVSEEEAIEEADFVLENLRGRKLDYPIVFDHEPVTDPSGRANKLSGEQVTASALAFCERIEAGGYTAMIYGNKQDISRLDLDLLEPYDIWFAEYDAMVPSGQFDFIMWQHSNNGSVAGIATRVDMNIHFLAA